MGEQKPKDTLLPISGVVALVVALGAILYSMTPLQGTRPNIPEIREEVSTKVRARLWQDPFRAVLDDPHAKESAGCSEVCFSKEALCEKGPGEKPLLKKIEARLKDGKTVTVLGIMVFGGPYAEDMEMRIRHRYAVLSGLLRLGCRPEDPDHISFLKTDNKIVSLRNIIPYEWVMNEQDDVLVLWINNDAFLWINSDVDLIKKQLFNLKCLFDNLIPSAKNGQLKFKVIGPAGSGHLLEMIKELKSKRDVQTERDSLSSLEIFTATATAAEWLLLSEAKEQNSDKISKLFEDRLGIKFKRQICTDDLLAKALIDELGLRNVNLLSGHRDHVVLVAESDTLFGWSLPRTFEKVLKDMLKKEGQQEDVKNFVHRYSYIRGLDGKVPGEQERDAKERKKNGSDRKEEELQGLEEPAGKSQYDYLRRLADKIYCLNRDLCQTSKGSVKAIGVLGSDFYDKYLVLQALGQRFPNVVFFTIDLDARFLYHPYNKWTRNLVVASGFGLQLRQGLQEEVPPFRDTHQTSLFLATLRAFADRPYNILQTGDLEQVTRPRIFEIGRTRAFDLTPKNQKVSKDNNIHPVPADTTLMIKSFTDNNYLIIFIIILFVMIYYLSKSSRRERVQRVLQNWDISILALVIVFYIIHLFNKNILNNLAQEPFSWIEGVSIWPTEIIRLFAIFLSLGFFIRLRKQLMANRDEIATEFCLGEPEEAHKPGGQLPWWHKWWLIRSCQYQTLRHWLAICPSRMLDSVKMLSETNLWHAIKRITRAYLEDASYCWKVNNEKGRVSMDELWAEYLRRGACIHRILRLLPYATLMTCIFLVVWPSMQFRPIRGVLSQRIDLVILAVTLIFFLFLTFFVFDSTQLCRRLITLIMLKGQAHWSSKSMAQFGRKLGRMEDELQDLMFVLLIGKRTEAVGKLIFYPFIILVLVLVARSHYFDNWSAPLGFSALIISLILFYTWSCAISLRLQAERTKKSIVNRLSKKLIEAFAADPHQERVEQIDFVLKEIIATRSGAFAPLLQQPVVQALLVPFGSIGGLQLLDILMKAK